MKTRHNVILDHFKKGDLLYGLQSKREAMIKELKKKHGDEQFITIDEYNKKISNYLISPTISQEDYNQQGYKKQIEDLINNSIEKTNPVLIRHIAMLCLFENKKVGLSTAFKKRNDDLSDRQIKRLCKARILDDNITIHFILDGIDPFDTFDEKNKQNRTYRSFTSTELRYIIKNFDDIEQHVKFYSNNQEISLLDWIGNFSADAKEVFKKWQCNPEKNRFHGKGALLERLDNAIAKEPPPQNIDAGYESPVSAYVKRSYTGLTFTTPTPAKRLLDFSKKEAEFFEQLKPRPKKIK